MFVVVLTAVVSLLLGVILTLLAEWYLFSQPASKTEPRAFPSVSPVKIQLPEVSSSSNTRNEQKQCNLLHVSHERPVPTFAPPPNRFIDRLMSRRLGRH